jgi:hypothetical protein
LGTDSLRKDARVNEFLDECWKFSVLGELIGERTDLFWSRNLSGEQKPEHTLREYLFAVCGGGKLVLAIRDGQSVEPDTLKIYGEF